jgi:uncharacterized protein
MGRESAQLRHHVQKDCAVKLHIADGLSLPDTTVTSTLVVYGGKGMGKTNCASVLVEELSRCHLRWAWLDPLGISWGLRHSQDGKGPGIECLILGGVHGDVPIEPDGGAAVADVVIEESVNVLIDFSRKPTGEMWSIGERIRFVNSYTRRLFQRQGDLINGHKRPPLFQVLDEAARYVPQTVPAGNPELSFCVAAWQQLVEEGRNINLGVALISQRSARLNKDVAELADAMLAFRTVGPNSLAAVLDWLGEHVEKSRIKELSERVRRLPIGHALVVSPGWLDFEGVVAIRQRHTFDSSATTKPGERARSVKGEGAKPDIAKIREKMAATIERAKADDPRELKRQIAELKKQLSVPVKTAPAVKPIVDQSAIDRAVKAAEQSRDRHWKTETDKLRKSARTLATKLTRIHAESVLNGELAAIEAPVAPPEAAKPASQVIPHVSRPAHEVAPRKIVQHPNLESQPDDSSLGKCERAILQVLNQHGPSDIGRIARLSVYRVTGGFRNALGNLRSQGYLSGNNTETMEITDAGRAVAPSELLPTGEELRRYWLTNRVFGKCERAVLQRLFNIYPKAESIDDLAANTEQDGGKPYQVTGGFRNALGMLRTAGVIEGKNTEPMRASPTLFE